MKVDLAYPWTDDKRKTHAPDSTVEVSAVVGKNMIRDGQARPAAAQKTRAATPGKAPAPRKLPAVKATPSKAPAPGADTKKEAGS